MGENPQRTRIVKAKPLPLLRLLSILEPAKYIQPDLHSKIELANKRHSGTENLLWMVDGRHLLGDGVFLQRTLLSRFHGVRACRPGFAWPKSGSDQLGLFLGPG